MATRKQSSSLARCIAGALALAPHLVLASAIAPPRAVETDALAPPVARQDVASSAGPARVLRALARPGADARFGLTVLGGGAPSEVVVTETPLKSAHGTLHVSASWVLAWPQRRRIVPAKDGADPSRVVRELLVRDARVPLPAAGQQRPAGLQSPAPPVACVAAGGLLPLLVTVRVPADAAPGTYSGELRVSSRSGWEHVAALEVRVLSVPEPPVPLPAQLFHRGRLGGAGEAPRWPEVELAHEIREDLELIARAGATHVTCMERVGELEQAHALRKDAGLAVEAQLCGWPRPYRSLSGDDAIRITAAVAEALDAWRDSAPPLFWLGDEPVGNRVFIMGRAAGIVRAAGGLTTATMQGEAATALAGLVDVANLDATERPASSLRDAAAVCRREGVEAWQYWQAWPEGGRGVRWNAGFAQVDELTTGQSAYCFAHVEGDPWDDFDAGHKDLLMVYPGADVLTPTLQLEAWDAGLEDLATWRAAAAFVGRARADGRAGARVARLAEVLERAGTRWSRVRNESWGEYDPGDVACRSCDIGPPAAALEQQRQDILAALERAIEEAGLEEAGVAAWKPAKEPSVGHRAPSRGPRGRR